MNRIISTGRRGDYEASDFPHNRRVKYEFERARRLAWGDIQDNPAVKRLMEEQTEADLIRLEKKNTTLRDYSQPILNMYK
jgi:hypothetical protein